MRLSITPLLLGLIQLMSCSAPPPDPILPEEDASPPANLMDWAALTDQPRPEPTAHRRYGPGPAGVVDVWIPEGAPPYPVVVIIHGGCWQKAVADRTLMNYAAEALRQDGIAVWNVEYRGVDETGGGYPGTFRDVSQATDLLRTEGPGLGLDLSNLVAFGHSAGGHLAGWVAGRPNLPPDSPLSVADPLPIKAVINSGGLADLEASKPVTTAFCLASIMDQLTGAPDARRADVLSDTSVGALLPLPANLLNVSGRHDRISPPVLGRDLTQKARDAGGVSAYYEVADSGHVELIAPGTAAFDVQRRLIRALLNDHPLPDQGP